MTKKAMRSLFGRLLELPTQINRAEADLLSREWERQAAAATLQAKEDELLLSGVDGKNEAVRQAALRVQTEAERAQATAAERAHAEARLQLSGLQAEFSATKAAAYLLAASR